MSRDNVAKAQKSNAERQAAYRRRKAAEQKTEVRGIFATLENADKIRRYAARLNSGGFKVDTLELTVDDFDWFINTNDEEN